MLKQLDDAFRFGETALRLRGQRQEILASNIANADTPNYKARDFDFSSALNAALSGGPRADAGRLAMTAPAHSPGAAALSDGLLGAHMKFRVPGQDNLDGNTVDMDLERTAFADNAIRYEAALNAVNSKFRSLKTAIEG